MGDVDALIAKINKKHGGPILMKGSDLAHLEILRCPTGSLAYDLMLGGGWPLNCWNEIVGNESHGKTVMALKTIVAGQQADPDHMTLWVASEDFNVQWAQQLGVDIDRITLALTNIMEEAYDIVLETLDERAVDAVIIDSYPALVPSEEGEKTMEDWLVGLGARLTNKFMRKSNTAQKRSLIEEDRPCLGIMINQWRDKIGVAFGDPRTTPGGKGKNFHFFTRVEVSRGEWISVGNERVGHAIKARTMKNKTAPPQREGQIDFYFDDVLPAHAKGEYDTAKEIATIATMLDIVERKGTMYCYDEAKWRGKDEYTAAVRSDPALQATLTALIRHEILHEELPKPKGRRVQRRSSAV